MMAIERLVDFERQRVALFVPKGARDSVWEKHLERYLPGLSGPFSTLEIYNHTDLHRKGKFPKYLQQVKEKADAIIIDEAHHFRNPGTKGEGEKRPSRYWKMFDICEDKDVYFLTATPVNNRLRDLQHMMELFTRREPDYFADAPLGIHSLRGHFRKMENELEREIGASDAEAIETNQAEAQEVLSRNELVQELVVQRSRAYVKKSQQIHGGRKTMFPQREPPKVADYSVRKTYGDLLRMIEKAFDKEKPLFSLAIYYPLHYYKGPDESIDPMEEGRQKQVAGLIRTLFLKRFESSAYAFMQSCHTLLGKLLAWVEKHSRTESQNKRLERWKLQNQDLIGYVHEVQTDLFNGEPPEEAGEDIVTEEMLEDVEELDPDEYKVDEILAETFLDLDELAKFLGELKGFDPAADDKVQALIDLLKSDPVLSEHKVLIFSEFSATARYVAAQLEQAGIEGVAELDSGYTGDRSNVIERFSPYYNGISSGGLAEREVDETRVLVSTDVLSEGLNLQDATRLINYDLHWNPVRLMQRIGRVDRRLDPETERRIIRDHPEQEPIRGTIEYWNFLPPDELEDLLSLYERVTHKTLRISKTFGIEGEKLLTPEDDFDALKNFNHRYEGTPTTLENLHIEFQELLEEDPDLEEHLRQLPGRVFSGKEHPSEDSRAVFFCYALPAPAKTPRGEEDTGEAEWTEEAGFVKWYLYGLDSGDILDEPAKIVELIRCQPDTPRHCEIPQETLTDIRQKLDKHITNTYLKKVQAPVGVAPTMKAWMELS
jgi:hypothetical protein